MELHKIYDIIDDYLSHIIDKIIKFRFLQTRTLVLNRDKRKLRKYIYDIHYDFKSISKYVRDYNLFEIFKDKIDASFNYFIKIKESKPKFLGDLLMIHSCYSFNNAISYELNNPDPWFTINKK